MSWPYDDDDDDGDNTPREIDPVKVALTLIIIAVGIFLIVSFIHEYKKPNTKTNERPRINRPLPQE